MRKKKTNNVIEFIPRKENYPQYVEIFKSKSDNLGRPLTVIELYNNRNELPSAKWLIDNCPIKINKYGEFLRYCGYNIGHNLSKEETVEIIYNMQSKLNRPLMYNDFRKPNENKVGITTVKKYWGTMNNMKKELGLTVNQDNMMIKHKTFKEAKEDIIKLCDYIYNTENRKIILSTDTNKVEGLLDFNTYRAYFKENNFEIRDFIENLGFELQKGGLGLNYTFDDGERVTSKYEYEFSRYLKNELHLQYNKDYFRDVKYKTFVEDYNELMNCDYIIHYQGRVIYIEIAGMLKDLHNYYYNDKIIKRSKAKEYYRQKLMKKEEMLKSINVEYYILFPINKNYQSVLDWDLINRIFNISTNLK